jgi:hypothetical protein
MSRTNDTSRDPLAEVSRIQGASSHQKAANKRLRLGLLIYKKRNGMFLTQGQLAKLCQTTQRIVSNLENGEVNVGFDLLGRLVEKLCLSKDEISEVLGCLVMLDWSTDSTNFQEKVVSSEKFRVSTF